jgi:hypothetical protein
MSFRPSQPVNRPVLISLCLLALTVAIALVAAASAHAAEYKAVFCAANSGAPPYTIATNTTSPQVPAGIFTFENDCVGQGGDPPGNSSLLRIADNQPSGNAGYGAYLSFTFETPEGVNFRSAGGYTREPNAFNDGWQARFWLTYMNGSPQLQMVQGTGLQGTASGYWGTTSSFASHLWPWSYPLDFYRWTFEMVCADSRGCDRSNYNATDLNGIVFTLRDWQDSQVNLTNTGSDLLSGRWVKGSQEVDWQSSDKGSGLRMERLRVAGTEPYKLDYQEIGACNTSSDQTNGEFARSFQPCPTGGPYNRSYSLNTANFSDGAHNLSVCTQDYAQWQGLNNTGGETCTERTIRTDNTAPGKPAALQIRSANPNRYLDHFGATFSLPPDPGSPIRKVHYEILGAANEVVSPEKTLSGTNPSEVPDVEGPAHAGAYHLKLWLEDEVGFAGPAAEVAIPHDTTPPAAPQDLQIAGPTTHWVKKLDLSWQDITDNGSPIAAAHYELVDGSGQAVGSEQTVAGDNIHAIQNLETPSKRGEYKVRVWLSDEEGNVGAAASVALPIDTTPPAAPQGLTVTPPSTARAADGFDVRWHDVTDNGSPIDAVHYQVLDAAGKVAVATQTVNGANVESIASLETPRGQGSYSLRLWLEDEEGNVGVPTTAPLAYDCVRSDAAGATNLSAVLGAKGESDEVLQQGSGSILHGRLTGAGGAVANAPICVFSRVITDSAREFLGLAVSGADGGYRFAIPAGASRELSVLYRSGQREVGGRASVETIVRPTFKVRKKIVRNKHFARFTGRLPGPDNNNVIVVLQVRRGKGWLAFRRYRTREGGWFRVGYRFNRTDIPTKYIMRAQVRAQAGYPYLQGNSKRLKLIVLPR